MGIKVNNMTQIMRTEEIIMIKFLQNATVIWRIIILNISLNRDYTMLPPLSLNKKMAKKINHMQRVVTASAKTSQISFYYYINLIPFISSVSGGIKNDSKRTIYSYKNSDFHLLQLGTAVPTTCMLDEIRTAEYN